MKLENYSPTFRNVLLREVKNEKTKGGIFIPSQVSEKEKMSNRLYVAVKVGPDCTVVKPGDGVKLMMGIHLEEFNMAVGKDSNFIPAVESDKELMPGHEFEFFSVMEQQIIGVIRK